MCRIQDFKAIPMLLLFAALCAAALTLCATQALATSATGSVYIVIDPYNKTQLAQLSTAASEMTCAAAEPYCTDTNGVLLDVDWCRYQGYLDSAAPTDPKTGDAYEFSCHYWVNAADAQTLPSSKTEDTHQRGGTLAAPTYDDTTNNAACASDVVQALAYIVEINALRKTAGRPVIRLSIGLQSGLATPEFVFLEEETEKSGKAAPLAVTSFPQQKQICGLEPQVWLTSYVTYHLAAYDELLSYVHTTMANAGNDGSPITLVKISPLNSSSLE